MKKYFLLLLLIPAMALAPPAKKITVYLIGDSTMADKRASAFPETGWGMPFKTFFDSSVIIDNRAKNGRSTGTFISENLWQPIADQLKEGDYVFIQFGHNDESKEKGERYTSPEAYRNNLVKFITEAREKKALPVLLSPVTRRRFDMNGKVVETHGVYSSIVYQVAQDTNTPFIDLDKKSRDLLEKFGEADSRYLFLQLEPGEHPNYPAGKDDNTHFSEFGARKIAQIVLNEIVALRLELAERVVKKTVKK